MVARHASNRNCLLTVLRWQMIASCEYKGDINKSKTILMIDHPSGMNDHFRCERRSGEMLSKVDHDVIWCAPELSNRPFADSGQTASLTYDL